MSSLPPTSTSAQLAAILQKALRQTGVIPPSKEKLEEQIDVARKVAKKRPDYNRHPAPLPQVHAVEARRDARGEALGPELPIDERRGLALDRTSKPPKQASKRAPKSAKSERWRAAVQMRAPRLRLHDWSQRISKRARQIGASPVEAARAVAELPRVFALRVRRAALGISYVRGQWVASRSWASPYARRTVAYAWAVFRASFKTKRRGFAHVALGVTQGMLAALVRNPQTLRPYSRAGMAATKCGANNEQCGPLVALERAGAWYAEQPPAEMCSVELVGPSGHPVQHYWISERSASAMWSEVEQDIAAVEPAERRARPFNATAAWMHDGLTLEPPLGA